MEKNTLTKLQKEQYNEIKTKFSKSDEIVLSDEENARLREVLKLLEEKEIIRPFEVDGGNVYFKIGSFDSFDEWQTDQAREERKSSAREWVMTIIGSLISFIPSFISTVKPGVVSLLNKLLILLKGDTK